MISDAQMAIVNMLCVLGAFWLGLNTSNQTLAWFYALLAAFNAGGVIHYLLK
jgi:hypothetical protein